MSHTIPNNKKINKRITPLALYESNYRRILKLFPDLIEANKQGNFGGILQSPYDQNIAVKIIEQYKYTCIVKLIKTISQSSRVNSANMHLRVCFDARLVEVIAFQGNSTLKIYHSYPNKEMILPDEKKQLNLHLKHILEMSLDCAPENEVLDMLLLKP